jgi:hypothetical protein
MTQLYKQGTAFFWNLTFAQVRPVLSSRQSTSTLPIKHHVGPTTIHSKCRQLEASFNYFLNCYVSLISAHTISASYLKYKKKKEKRSTAYVNASIFSNQTKPQPYISYQHIKRYRSETRRRIIRETEANLRRLVLERASKTTSAANSFKRQWILQTADNYAWSTLQNVYRVCMFVVWKLISNVTKKLSSVLVY